MIRDVAGAIGKGLVAGAVGTAAMTLSSTLEMKLRGRSASDAPARAAGKVLGVEPKSENERKRFSNIVHWDYGISWGAVRGLLAETGMHQSTATIAHFIAVWGTALTMLPALEVAPPPQEWGAEELAIDAFHHAVYAGATGAAYTYIERH